MPRTARAPCRSAHNCIPSITQPPGSPTASRLAKPIATDMNEPTNPYAVSEATQNAPLLESTITAPLAVAVPRGTRFLNYIIDYVVEMGLGLGLGLVIGLSGSESAIDLVNRTPDLLFGVIISLAYFMLAEGLTGRTIGKLITGTKVVDSNGNRPSAGRIVVRTLSRFIPFEALSFLGSDARGWHDKISKTYVVKCRS